MPPMAEVDAAQPQKENVKSSNNYVSIDDLFARLEMKNLSLFGLEPEDSFVARQDSNKIPSEGHSNIPKAELSDSTVPVQTIPNQSVADGQDLVEPSERTEQATGTTQVELENEFMRKASAYIDALPDSSNNTVQSIKVVSKKLHSTYAPVMDIDQKSVEAIKARFAFSIANYLNKVLGKGPKTHTPESIKQTLKDVDGDFLKFCCRLVEEKHISLETLDDVAGLVKAVLDILPKAEASSNAGVQESKRESDSPVGNMEAWPSQAKRDNRKLAAFCFTYRVLTITSSSPTYLFTEWRRSRSQYQPAAGFGLGWQA